jgi:hypothetical protein
VYVKLPHVLTSPNYSLLLSSKLLADLGSSAINTQLAINGVIDWTVIHDVFYVCNIPLSMDLSDVLAMGSAVPFVNLLTGTKQALWIKSCTTKSS